LVEPGGSGFCAKHSSAEHQTYYRKRVARRDPSVGRYGTVAWQKARAEHLRIEPYCRDCRALGLLRLATVVDHIRPVKQGGDFFDEDNLQSLCNRCHERKSTQEGSRGRGGG
jgi:5-methylcytosine-specific restriction protein A